MNFLNRAFAKKETPTLANGILLVGSAHFRSVCAVHASGTVTVANGYEHDKDRKLEYRKLLARGEVPQTTHVQSVPIDQIAALYKSLTEK